MDSTYPPCLRHADTEKCLSEMGFSKPKSVSKGPKHWRRLVNGAFNSGGDKHSNLVKDMCNGIS